MVRGARLVSERFKIGIDAVKRLYERIGVRAANGSDPDDFDDSSLQFVSINGGRASVDYHGVFFKGSVYRLFINTVPQTPQTPKRDSTARAAQRTAFPAAAGLPRFRTAYFGFL
jgi:hypothetical protein